MPRLAVEMTEHEITAMLRSFKIDATARNYEFPKRKDRATRRQICATPSFGGFRPEPRRLDAGYNWVVAGTLRAVKRSARDSTASMNRLRIANPSQNHSHFAKRRRPGGASFIPVVVAG
jgi:hypothetical protein